MHYLSLSFFFKCGIKQEFWIFGAEHRRIRNSKVEEEGEPPWNRGKEVLINKVFDLAHEKNI